MKGVEVKIYLNEDVHIKGRSAFEAIIELANTHDILVANVSRCILGYSKDKLIHTTKYLQLSRNLPLKIELTDSKDKITTIMDELKILSGEGVITVREVDII